MVTVMLESNFINVLMLVGLLGFRHGFDADHIAAIDGLTRARQLLLGGPRSYWATRWVGAQFALGHSAVIGLVSLLLVGQSATLPTWLDGLGLFISVGFLLIIAATNLAHAFGPRGTAPLQAGPLSAALLRVTGGQLHPALVGMAFAMSFDAFGQAAFFASHGHELSSTMAVVMLASVFGVGMLLADAANGALLNWFAQRSDALAQRASRWSSAFIASIALLTAAASIARTQHGTFARAWDDAGLWAGLGLMVVVCAVYGLRLMAQASRPRAAR